MIEYDMLSLRLKKAPEFRISELRKRKLKQKSEGFDCGVWYANDKQVETSMLTKSGGKGNESKRALF